MLKWQEVGYEPSVTLSEQPKRLKPAELDGGSTPAMMEEKKAREALRRLEQQLKDALRTRTTAQLGEHQILRRAFVKFDKDQSGSVDLEEFCKALEHLGLHCQDVGLPGWGGVPQSVMRAQFERFDADSSGTIEYDEFLTILVSTDDTQTKMY